MRQSNTSSLKLTLEAAAREIGCSKETLRRKLVALGEETGRGKKYSLGTIFNALIGALKVEQTREVQARADLLELKRKERQGDLVPMELAEKVLRNTLAPVREQLLAMPANLAARCNPTDPTLARRAIEAAVDRILRSSQPKGN